MVTALDGAFSSTGASSSTSSCSASSVSSVTADMPSALSSDVVAIVSVITGFSVISVVFAFTELPFISSTEAVYQNGPEDFLKCGSYIFVPMALNESVIGVVALARRYGSQVFTEKEFRNAQVLTDYACASIQNVYSFQEIKEHSEMTREAEISGKIQQTLIPKQLPQIPGLSLGAFTNTSEGVCGDYYDVLPSRKERVSFLMSDVAGKGMSFALAAAKSSLP